MTIKGDETSERKKSLWRIVNRVLLGLGLLSFFLPSVNLNAPIVGNVEWSAFNVVSGIVQSQNVERPSFQGIVESRADSDSTESHSLPLSIKQGVLFPIAMLLAYLALCFILVAEFFGLSAKSVKRVGILGMVCSLFGLLSIFVLSNGFRKEMGSSFDAAPADASPFSGIGRALVQSIRIEPGSGLYLLSAVMVLLFLVHKLSALDFLEFRVSLNSNSAANSTSLVTAAPSDSGRGTARFPTRIFILVSSILIAIVAIALFAFKSSGPDPTQARKQLAKMGIQYDVEDFIGAAYKGDTKAVRLLLDAGMSPNERDDHGSTALIAAITGERTSISRVLVERGADVNAKDHEGWTPLGLVVRSNDIQTTKLLLDKGADSNVSDPKGITPLLSAVLNHQIDQVKLLLDRGADPNRKDDNGFTSLMFAAHENDASVAVGMVRMLLTKGAQVNIQTNDGRTALSIAVQEGHSAVVDELKRAGARLSF